MLGSFKLYGMAFGGVMVVGGGLMFMQANDLQNNYTKVSATITTVEHDCFVKNGREKIVKKGTTTMAYMDCKIAPFIVGKFGFEKKHIKKRAKVKYEYTSPVGQDYHIGSFNRRIMSKTTAMAVNQHWGLAGRTLSLRLARHV